ncbi:P-loop containing nucleoside triphosphate hydrolase protein [Mycena vitilis]|nr:P-loop containing nucleoside triphosphate hydrolase protein [Mycena vitilis]
MRLAACIPAIPEHLVSSLEQCGIRTDADLLFSGTTLEILGKLPASSRITLRELVQATSFVANLASVPGQNVSELIKVHATETDGDFLSGLPQLDEILHELTAPHRLVEISGDKGSGKTTLLLHLVLHHLVHHSQSSVLWIDTTGDFSAIRAAEMLEHFDLPGTSVALERLQLSSAFELDAVHEVLEELRLSFNPDSGIRAIVLDAITPLFSPILSPVSSQGHAIMTGFMRQLRAFAQIFSMTVFVVNNSTAFTPFVAGSVSNNPNIRKPALGPSFTFLTDATLWLALCSGDPDPRGKDAGNECTKHVAQVYRSKVTMSTARRTFEIRQGVFVGRTD